jgi:ubiquinone/menaquinone biosynthesis C-methylase UbiE
MRDYDKLVVAIMQPAASAWFFCLRAVRHDQLLRERGLTGSRGWLRPVGLALRAGNVLARCWRSAFTHAATRCYAKGLARHYGPCGLAYSRLTGETASVQLARFQKQEGRVRFYLHDQRVLDFSDGDSFLDCGCGPGQNVVELRRAFPASPVKAFDWSNPAVAMILERLSGDPLVAVEHGDLLDPTYLAGYPDDSVDHVLISHVMGFLLRSSVDETRAARQHIVDELIRIARRTILVLDRIELGRQMSIEIEQRDRGVVHDDLTRYFERHSAKGQLYIMQSPVDAALIFKMTDASDK